MIDASLNEVEAIAAKAARGAGLNWGLCEDTGKAARWLAHCGIDWSASLVALLNTHHQCRGPLDTNTDRRLSPLLAGTYIADLGVPEAVLADVAYPAWLLPFASRVAAHGGNAVRVRWGGLSVIVWPIGCDVADTQSELQTPEAEQISCALVTPGRMSTERFVTLPRCTRSAIASSDWHTLERLGARTYVPASARSRAKGAGAGSIDND